MKTKGHLFSHVSDVEESYLFKKTLVKNTLQTFSDFTPLYHYIIAISF